MIFGYIECAVSTIGPLLNTISRAKFSYSDPKDYSVAGPIYLSMNQEKLTQEMEQKLRDLLEREIRPAVQMDCGDVEFVSYEPVKRVVTVRMSGACQGCPMSEITLKQGIQNMFQEKFPEILEVVTVDEV